MAKREVTQDDSYIERVKKMIPAEVSAGFLAINSLIPLNSEHDIYVLAFFICLVIICFFYLREFEGVKNIVQVAFISLIAFPIWALNIAIARFDWLQTKAFVAAGLLILVTLVTPLLVKRPQ